MAKHVCICYTYRPIVMLLSVGLFTCMAHCSETPAAIVGNVYPRGYHWAVGHLMGKKSIEIPLDRQANNQQDCDDDTVLDGYEGPASISERFSPSRAWKRDAKHCRGAGRPQG